MAVAVDSPQPYTAKHRFSEVSALVNPLYTDPVETTFQTLYLSMD